MHFTAENIIEIIKSVTLLVAAIAGCIAAWKGTRAEYHGKVAATKIETLTDNVNGRMGELLAVQKAASYQEGCDAEKNKQQNRDGAK